MHTEQAAQIDRWAKDVATHRVQQTSPTEEALESARTLREHHDGHRMLQEIGTKADNMRLQHEHRRAFLTMASSLVSMEQCLRYESLRRLAQLSEAADPAWAGIAYQESPRSLSMGATMWTHWETPMCPWTTWKAAWVERPVHPAPPMTFKAKRSKFRWRRVLLRRHRPNSVYKPKWTKIVTKIKPPVIQKTAVGGSRFIEDVPEYAYNQRMDMLRMQLARQRHQDRVVLAAKGEDLTNKWQNREKSLAGISEKEESDVPEKRLRKRDIVNELFCCGIFHSGRRSKKAPR